MAFFGFDPPEFEKEKDKALESAEKNSDGIEVFHWGGDDYDGLGERLQEGGDELNDETFGDAGPVGKDFDFSAATSAGDGRQEHPTSTSRDQNLSSIWDTQDPLTSASRPSKPARLDPAQLDPLLAPTRQPISARGQSHTGVRTLQDIESELFSNAQAQREREEAYRREQLLLTQQQEQQQRAEEEYFRREELRRRRELYEQEQLELQRLQQQQQLLQQRQVNQRTPPRMMPTSQSPRFLEHQRQVLLLQQQQEQQQLLRLQELQEQLKMEELERQFRAQQISQHGYGNGRNRTPPISINEYAQALSRNGQRSQSPGQLQSESAHLSRNAQLQQSLLAQMAQSDILHDLQGVSPAEQEQLRAEAMRKILEAEKMEEKRRRKAEKLSHMSRYNDLMTQSDKDFITRIQVSQLVTQDPYTDDFYAQVYDAVRRSRLGLQATDERVLKFGNSGGVGLGVIQKGGTRRPNAMQRMEQQVERIVSNARRREEEKGLHAVQHLQGALGKTSGRSYKAAPRQLLQVDSNASVNANSDHDNAAAHAARLGREALGNMGTHSEPTGNYPFDQRQVLMILENLYDEVMEAEQLRQNQPPPEEGPDDFEQWSMEYKALVDQIWTNMQVMVPLASSVPHPFISLLQPSKGKKILPRLTRLLDNDRILTMLTLLIACFSQLDVVTKAHILEDTSDHEERTEVERQTQAFLTGVLQSILPPIVKGNLRLITGLLGLLLDRERNDIVLLAKTRPGLALLTLFLSRVEVIKQGASVSLDSDEPPDLEELEQWQMMFDHLFQHLAPHLNALFPSTRYHQSVLSQEPGLALDSLDQPVWQFLAAFALHGGPEHHQILVASLREKILLNVSEAKKEWVDAEERQAKLANVNLFLHAVGLDSSQILM